MMVVNKRGDRRVVRGPTNVLLEYDERLEVVATSTGMPKSESNRARDVYLRLRDNRVEDSVALMCRDRIAVTVQLALRGRLRGGRDDAVVRGK